MHVKRWAWGIISLCTLLLSACSGSGSASVGTSSTATTTSGGTTSVNGTPTATAAPGATATPGSGAVLHGGIRDIQMADAQNGWGLTTWSNPPAPAQQVIHTADGGHTWADVTPPGYDATKGFLILASQSATGAWATSNATGISSTNSSTLWHSTDSGATWQTTTIATSNIGEIDFIDAQHGWIMSTPGGGVAGPTYFDLWQTTDGGATWHQIVAGQAFGIGGAISFLTTTTGFGVANNPSSGPAFYVTHDGGHTWAPTALTVPTYSSAIANVALGAPVFTSATDGAMGANITDGTTQGGSLHAVAYQTLDGGATWTPSKITDGDCITSLHATDALFAACVPGVSTSATSPPSFYHHVGSSWQQISIDATSDGELAGLLLDGALDMISATTGWAIATAGLLQTTDGGHTWAVILPAPPAGS